MSCSSGWPVRALMLRSKNRQDGPISTSSTLTRATSATRTLPSPRTALQAGRAALRQVEGP
eukprot:1469236-Lingulodinium_polyedra.AAC.1